MLQKDPESDTIVNNAIDPHSPGQQVCGLSSRPYGFSHQLHPMKVNLPDIARSLSAFVLITAFLLLSFCPLRRAIQDLVSGINRTEAAASRPHQSLTNCQGLSDRSGSKLIMPEANSQFKAPVLAITLVSLYHPFRRFRLTSQEHGSGPYSILPYLDPVPIYRRNRVILI